MSTAELLKKFEKLSPVGQDLIQKEIEKLFIKENSTQVKPRAQFGELRGVVKFIADDFDAPLEDFKDYM